MENPDRVTYFAATDSRGKRLPFGLKEKDRSRHMYVIGKTGMGKSTLLENMAIQDIRNGEGLAFIDPHGGTADKLLEYIPANRINDVVYFAPFDLNQPIAFNVMEDVGYDKRHLVVSGLMATFKKIWEDAWSARMEYILTNTLLALLEYPDATLLGVNRMYTDKAYRKKVVDNVKDPVVKDFWVKEFAAYTDRYTQEATPSIQNKIGQFTGNPLIRNIIGQPKSSFDFRDLMDRKKILIINLSKGQVGETNMRLLGSMLTTRIFLGAMSRADLSGADIARQPNFYFYVDEFQNFANETFAEILSEARKYKLNLIIAHQYIEQMEEEVRAAVFGNVGTTVAFRVGPFDAETLETIFMPEFIKDDLVNLGLRQIYLTLMIDGVGSRPFSAVTIPPIEAPPTTYRDEVIQASRQQFGAPRSQIEEYIFNELLLSTETSPENAPAPSRPPVRRTPSKEPTARSQNSEPRREDHARSVPAHTERPRELERPQEVRQEPVRTPPAKSAEDLKSILRTMTSSQNAKKNLPAPPSSPNAAQTPSLKTALSDVLKKQGPPPTTPSRVPELKEALAAVERTHRPFEVPEETLKAIFKEQ
ncbi:type IV secretion system DNA-binding domain-containing protein [Patescibacteria group bacterium]|nr:type IV secretion system DNA-binding domain-containing protein [Patescibacteria group bacterium]